MALLSLDRHDVLETIRQSNSLHEAFLRAAKLPAVGEYRTATNADRLRSMSDEEFATAICKHDGCPFREAEDDECLKYHCDCKDCWLDWLKEEVEEGK